MTKQDFVILDLALGVAEPSGYFLNVRVRAGTFAFQIQSTVFGAIAHSRKVVGNGPQALHSRKLFGPYRRLVAVHIAEELLAIGALQHCFDFTCKFAHLFNASLWPNARMHHGVAVLMMNEAEM